MIPESEKQSGVCYALAEDGMELPVLDVTHPAFECNPTPERLAVLRRETVRKMRLSAWMPRLLVRSMARRSIVVRGTLAASNGYLSATATYLQKLGARNLRDTCFTPLDRKMLDSLGPVAVRLRAEEVARLLAQALAPMLRSRGGPLHFVNLAGGAAVDCLNALILLHKGDPSLLRSRTVTIHVFDIDESGPAFGGRALDALKASGGPLAALDARMVHTHHDWNDTRALGRQLAAMLTPESIVACSSEGGLFEYAPDETVRANLAVLLGHTPADCVMAGSLARDNDVLRSMKRAGKLALVLRDPDAFARLAHHEGWQCKGGSSNPMYEVFLLRKGDTPRQDTAFNLGKVPETLLLPLWGRAELTRSGSRILRDEAAVRLIDQIEYDFSKMRADLNYSKNLSWLARARQFDDKVKAFAAREPEATIVNLGAGLDTTFARVDNGRLRWFDLDLPEVIAIRKRLIPETERSTCIEGSVFDPAWMEPLASTSGKLMLVAGGVLFYFTEQQVKELLQQIGKRLPGAELVFDAMTPGGVKLANKMMRKVGMGSAVIQWGLTDAKLLESWGAGVELVEQFEYFRGLDRKGLPPAARFMTLANWWYGAMTIVHCRWASRRP